MVTEWKKYQEDVAGILRRAGFAAQTDVEVQGARASHYVDVVGSGEFASVPVQWLVECKRLKRPVTKAHVLTFQQVVADTGADRGLILSESGYQAGAIAAGRRTNMRLTSLDELSDELSDAIGGIELQSLWRRVRTCRERYWRIDKETRIEYDLRPDVGEARGYRSMSMVRMVEEGISQALTGSFPIDWSNSNDAHVFPDVALQANSNIELSRHLEGYVSDLERRLEAVSRRG